MGYDYSRDMSDVRVLSDHLVENPLSSLIDIEEDTGEMALGESMIYIWNTRCRVVAR